MFNRFNFASSGKYYEFKIHSDISVLSHEIIERDYRQITSIDPGKKNFTIRIERRYSDRVVTGVFKRLNLTVENDESIESSLVFLSNELDEIKYDLYNSDFIFIEKQLPNNYTAVRIAQHALSYCMTKFKNNPRRTKIFEITPKLKNLVINPPKKTKAKEIKKLSVIRGEEYLEKGNDKFALEILIQNKKKQDDLCDTICQLEAMLIELNISDGL